MMNEFYYRVEDKLTTNGVEVYCHEFLVIKHTPKGVWVESLGYKRFVHKNSRKRYACPTIPEAIESFQARKRRQIKILKNQLKNAEIALNKAVNCGPNASTKGFL